MLCIVDLQLYDTTELIAPTIIMNLIYAKMQHYNHKLHHLSQVVSCEPIIEKNE